MAVCASSSRATATMILVMFMFMFIGKSESEKANVTRNLHDCRNSDERNNRRSRCAKQCNNSKLASAAQSTERVDAKEEAAE